MSHRPGGCRGERLAPVVRHRAIIPFGPLRSSQTANSCGFRDGTLPPSGRYRCGSQAARSLKRVAFLRSMGGEVHGRALMPRRYKRNPNIPALRRGYLNKDPAVTNLAVIDSIEAALLYNVDVVRWKIR